MTVPPPPGVDDLTIIRPLTFPVMGPVSYSDGWGDYRADMPDHFHRGVDLLATKLQPLVAVSDGVITKIGGPHPTAGYSITLTDADGWSYLYLHLNDDTPGTEDGAAPPQWRLAPGVTVGATVKAGQLLAYLGDSGDAKGTPHLHFEIKRPDGRNVNPFPSVRAAQPRTRCSLPAGYGSVLLPLPVDTDAQVVDVPVAGGGDFLLSANGTVFAVGSAKQVGSDRFAAIDGACPAVPAAVPTNAPVTAPSAATPATTPAPTPGR